MGSDLITNLLVFMDGNIKLNPSHSKGKSGQQHCHTTGDRKAISNIMAKAGTSAAAGKLADRDVSDIRDTNKSKYNSKDKLATL